MVNKIRKSRYEMVKAVYIVGFIHVLTIIISTVFLIYYLK